MSAARDATNWGRWGEDDERGAANLLTPEAVLAACRRPAVGRVYELGIELRRGAPVGGNRVPPMHFMTQDGGDFAALGRTDWGTADDYLVLATQGTTHVDGLAHVWSGGALYNGFPFTEVRSSGAGRLGLEKLGGLVASAHVLDFTDLRGAASEITAELVDGAFAARGTRPLPGDAVLFRTGWMDDALAGNAVEDTYPVVAPSMGRWFAEHDIAIVGADNIAVEATGRRGVLPPLHKVLVRDLGVSMLELLDLRGPGEDNVEGGLLVVAPLRISRGVGSPVNPLLIV
ncbi:MAG TPA: cyclase family protein [Acidimicrobiales bacterium]|jgi:kynurenine formamidase|nr:cyclase family protein [Acidimicrobiales bacterium]